MFEAARTLTRLWSHARVELRFIRPIPDDASRLEVLLAFVYVAVESLDGALPLVRSRSNRAGTASSVRDDHADPCRPLGPGVTGDVLLTEFCSDPLRDISAHPKPIVASRNTRSRYVRVFNPDGAADEPFDMAIANLRSPVCPHPATLDPPTYGDNTTIRFPTRHLLIDTYLEKSLAASSLPAARVLRTGEAQYTEPSLDDCWYDALFIEPTLVHLGRGVGLRPSPVYDRVRELSTHVVRAARWDDTDFIGYRLEVDYPFWQTAYCTEFEFAADRP